MSFFPAETSLILVVVVTHPRDLEIARVLGWYRIPLRFAPKVLEVDSLAFYQTAGFGEEERWQIQYVAEVRGHELTTRGELLRDERDHPRVNEEYYKIQLGPLERLPHPIPSQNWRRITFLYTTGGLLRTARSVSDLVVRNEDRVVLWRGLRERALHAAAYRASELPEDCFELDEALLAMLGDLNKINEPGVDYYPGE